MNFNNENIIDVFINPIDNIEDIINTISILIQNDNTRYAL